MQARYSGAGATGQDGISDISNGGGDAPEIEKISPAALKAIHTACRMVSECPSSYRAIVHGTAKVVRLEDGEGCDGLDKLAEYIGVRLPGVSIDDIQGAIAEGVKAAIAELAENAEAEAALAAAREGYSDDALALELVYRHGGELRYVAVWSKWLIWDGTRWRREETLAVFNMAREMLRQIAEDVRNAELRNQLRSSKTRGAVESMARSDRAVALRHDDFDQDIWLLNTPGGTVDLRSGVLRPHDPADHITKIAGATPGGKCPKWQAFLDTVTGGDKELQRFLQRMCGYCLTGSTAEHALFFLYGTGQNGKSVFMNVIKHVLGDYARTSSMETLNDSEGHRHPTEIAGLQGARMVTVSETEEGAPWAEARIKKLTGGDPIAARYMRQDEFEFQPQFKLVIAGNHKPTLRTVDKAMNRRLNMVPFTVTIPEDDRDIALTETLQSQEADGILAWAVEGCLEWQKIGLNSPAAVTDATDKYFEAQDSHAAWISEQCDSEPLNTLKLEAIGDLYASWSAYCKARGIEPGSTIAFGDKMETKGYQRGKARVAGKSTRVLKGIRLLKNIKKDSKTASEESP